MRCFISVSYVSGISNITPRILPHVALGRAGTLVNFRHSPGFIQKFVQLFGTIEGSRQFWFLARLISTLFSGKVDLADPASWCTRCGAVSLDNSA